MGSRRNAQPGKRCAKCHKYPVYQAADRYGDQDTYCTGCKRPEHLCTCRKKPKPR